MRRHSLARVLTPRRIVSAPPPVVRVEPGKFPGSQGFGEFRADLDGFGEEGAGFVIIAFSPHFKPKAELRLREPGIESRRAGIAFHSFRIAIES